MKRQLVLEGSRDRFLDSYVELLRSKGIDTNLGQLKTFLLRKFASEFSIHSLSKSSNYYLAGVTRYYFEGKITTNKRLNIFYENVTDKPIREICQRLDALIEILRNSYIDSVGTKFEQPEDFGTLPIDKLLSKYKKKIDNELGILPKVGNLEPEEKEPITGGTVNRNYTYEIIYDYSQLKKYEDYTKPGAWCITYGKQHYDNYIRRLKGIHYVVFRMKGFENVPRKIGSGYTSEKPHDEYGNSLICLLQRDQDPEPTYITSRWNHGYGANRCEADYAYTKEELLKVIGANESILKRIYNEWKESAPLYKKLYGSDTRMSKEELDAERAAKLSIMRKFKQLQMAFNGGARVEETLRKLWNNGDGTRIQSKLIRQSVDDSDRGVLGKDDFIITIYSDDESTKYSTILARNKFLFDKVFTNKTMNVIQYRGMNSVALIYATESGKPVGVWLYDMLKKDVITTRDGVFKFKHFPEGIKWEEHKYNIDRPCILIELALSNRQKYVFDARARKFLTTPDGNCVFEDIHTNEDTRHYRRRNSVEVNSHFFDPEADEKVVESFANDSVFLMELVYDSSAGIKYVYDVTNNRFAPSVYVNNDGEQLECSVYCSTLKGYVPYSYKSGEYWQRRHVYVSTETGEKLNIMGVTTFRYLSNKNCGIILFRPQDSEIDAFCRSVGILYDDDFKSRKDQFSDNCFMYDSVTGKLVEAGGLPLFGRSHYKNPGGYVALTNTNERLGSTKINSPKILYNPISHKVLEVNGEAVLYINESAASQSSDLAFVIPYSEYEKYDGNNLLYDRNVKWRTIGVDRVLDKVTESIRKDFFNMLWRMG